MFGRQNIATLAPLAGLIFLVVAFSILSPRFFSLGNASLIMQQVMIVGTLAIGQTLIIVTAGIDLSNGTIMVFSSVVMAQLGASGTSLPLAIVIGLALAAFLSIINGLAIAWLWLPPFIVTLGMFNITYAAARIYTDGASVSGLPQGLLFMGQRFSSGGTPFPIGVVVMLLIVVTTWYMLSQTAWGRHVYAVGDNPEAARLSGIRIRRLMLSVYAIAGVIYFLTALLLLGRTSVGDPNVGFTYNLQSITAVVIGGTSLFGGRGTVVGTLIGALIVGVIQNGLTLVGVDALYQTLVTGTLVIVAVAVDQFARSRAA